MTIADILQIFESNRKHLIYLRSIKKKKVNTRVIQKIGTRE